MSSTAKKALPSSTAIKNPFKPQLPVREPVKETVPERGHDEGPKPVFPSPLKQETKKQVTVPPSLNITGLIWNSDRPQAIINGQVVDVGDVVQDVEIVAIHKTGVDINFNGEVVTIKP